MTTVHQCRSQARVQGAGTILLSPTEARTSGPSPCSSASRSPRGTWRRRRARTASVAVASAKRSVSMSSNSIVAKAMSGIRRPLGCSMESRSVAVHSDSDRGRGAFASETRRRRIRCGWKDVEESLGSVLKVGPRVPWSPLAVDAEGDGCDRGMVGDDGQAGDRREVPTSLRPVCADEQGRPWADQTREQGPSHCMGECIEVHFDALEIMIPSSRRLWDP